MTMVRQRYQLTPSRDINIHRILESNWNRWTAGQTHPVVVIPSLNDYLHAKQQQQQQLRYQLILSREIYDQRILQSDWTRA